MSITFRGKVKMIHPEGHIIIRISSRCIEKGYNLEAISIQRIEGIEIDSYVVYAYVSGLYLSLPLVSLTQYMKKGEWISLDPSGK